MKDITTTIVCVAGIIVSAYIIYLIFKSFKIRSSKSRYVDPSTCKHTWIYHKKQLIKQHEVRVCSNCGEAQDRIKLNSGEVIRDWSKYE